jgi:hypothetical protein
LGEGYILRVPNEPQDLQYVTSATTPTSSPTPSPNPTPTLTPLPPTPTLTPLSSSSVVLEIEGVSANRQGRIIGHYPHEIHVVGDYMALPIWHLELASDTQGKNPILCSLEDGIEYVSAKTYSLASPQRCHNSANFGSSDFDGTYFVSGYSNSGIYGNNIDGMVCGRLYEGGIIVFKKNSSGFDQKTILYPPFVPRNDPPTNQNSPNHADYFSGFGAYGTKLDEDYLITKALIAKKTGSYNDGDPKFSPPYSVRFFVYKRDGDDFNLLNHFDDDLEENTTFYKDYGAETTSYEILDANNGYLFVGSHIHNAENTGIVKIYKRDASLETYSHSQDLLPPTPTTNKYFGYRAKAHGNLLIVSQGQSNEFPEGEEVEYYSAGSDFPHQGGGSVWFYELNTENGNYELKSQFEDLDRVAWGRVAIKNNTAAVSGLPYPNPGHSPIFGPEEGIVHLFDRDSSTGLWNKREPWKTNPIKSSEVKSFDYYPDDQNPFRGFGASLELSDDGKRLYVLASYDIPEDATSTRRQTIYDISISPFLPIQ